MYHWQISVNYLIPQEGWFYPSLGMVVLRTGSDACVDIDQPTQHQSEMRLQMQLDTVA